MKVAHTFNHEEIKGFKFGSNPMGKPSMFSHIYFIDGLLIDTGHSNMRKEILRAVSPLPIDQIFITHHHEDHTGNLTEIISQFTCPAYASSLCVEMMKNPPAISFAQKLFWGSRPANFELQPKEQSIQTPHHTFEVIPIPGHAVDMVCLYEKNEGWLFSADLWVYEYIRIFMRPESMKQQIESHKKVLTLDFDILLCSHNPQFEGGKEKVKKKLAFLENFYGQVAGLHQRGHSISSIFKEMKLKEKWVSRILSGGELSTLNMVKSVVRDES